jgi:hypothetical protein
LEFENRLWSSESFSTIDMCLTCLGIFRVCDCTSTHSSLAMYKARS